MGDAYLVLENSHLYIWNGTEFTDGGSVVGPQGPPGAGITYKGTLPEIISLDGVTGQVQGDAYVVLENSHLYI